MNNETKHTPGPWTVGCPDKTDYYIMVGGHTQIAWCPAAHLGSSYIVRDKKERAANARRIVACVNAAEGISTEALEACRDIAAAGIATVRSVEAQRDELAAALRKIMNAHNSGNNGAYMGEATVCRAFALQANEALAKLQS